ATVSGGMSIKFRHPTRIVEAIDGSGEALLRDRDYVHVAARPIGLGKVVFLSFAMNALDESQPQVAALWRQLLELDRPQWDWNRARLGEQRREILGTMIGRKVAGWGIAAGIAGGYLLGVLLAQ